MLIQSTQVELNNMGAVIKALPHLARPSDRTAKEVLSFICIMLFNANEEIQVLIHLDHGCWFSIKYSCSVQGTSSEL